MKTKIVDEYFNEKKGITVVTIQNKYGHFSGTAHCHPNDSYSMFQGERIAATKANIKYLKHRISIEKAKIKTLKEFNNSVKLNKNQKTLNRHIKKYENNIQNFKDSIFILKDSIKKMDEERQKVLFRSKTNK